MDDRSLRRFNGEDDDAGKQLKRWKAWAMAKMATLKDLKKEQRAPWIFTLLDGAAWECCEHFTLQELSSENGEKDLWATLEDRFPQKEPADLMGEALGEAFGLSGVENETMKQWCARVRDTFDKCHRRASVSFPEPAKGWIALHCVGLSEEQKAIVKAKTQGSLDFADVSQALRSCFPQYRVTGSRSKKAVGALQVDQLPSAAEPENEPEDTFDDVEAFLAESNLTDPAAEEVFSEGETAEALMASWSERRKEINRHGRARRFNQSSAQSSRSFRIEVEELKKRTKCRKCGKIGHWQKECRSNVNRSESGSAPSQPAGASYVEVTTPTFVGAAECWAVGQENLPSSLVSSPGYGVVDSGCGRTLIGAQTLDQLEQLIASKGPWRVESYESENTFRFGNGMVETTKKAVRIPVGLSKQYGVIDAAVVAGSAPLLLGRPTLEKLNMNLDFKRSTMVILEKEFPMTTNQAGQILLDIMDFPVVPVVKKAQGPKVHESSKKHKITLKPKECRCLLAQLKVHENHSRSRVQFAELFSPPRFTTEIEHRGGRGKAYDLKLGDDLTDPKVQRRVDQELDSLNPEVLTLCPPCTYWGGWDHLNRIDRSPLENARLNRVKREQVKYCQEQIRKQRARGGDFLFEHPLGSDVWDEPGMISLKRDYGFGRADLCAYGLKCPDTGKPIKKATGIITSQKDVRDNLRRCPGCAEHRSVSGKLSSGQLVSDFVAKYPSAFVKQIVDGFQQHLKDPDNTRTQINLAECQVECLASEAHEDNSPDRPAAVVIPDDNSHDQPEVGNVTRALRRLHSNLGHPSNKDLVRILRNSGASEEAIRQARELECSVCHNHKAPSSALPANVSRATRFNEKIGLDVKYLPGWKPNQKVPCINIIDYATSLQVMCPIFQRETAEVTIGVLRDSWIHWAGVPEHLELDSSKPNLSAMLAEYCESRGIVLHHIAADAHWQLGKVERHGQWFQSIFKKVCDEHPPLSAEDFVERVSQAQQAKNSLISERGASPFQHVFGRNPSIPEDLLQEQPNLAVSESITCDDASAQANAVRQAARRAVLECQDDKALRAALRARPRVFRDFKSGDWVYYWRSQKWEKGTLINDGRWYGPALTLGLVGRNVMVAHRRNILRCAPEHVRHVTEEEKVVVESPESELLGIKNLLSQGQFPRNQFVDLLQQPAPPEPNVCSPVVGAPIPEVSRAPNAAEVLQEVREAEAPDTVMTETAVGEMNTNEYGPVRRRYHHKSKQDPWDIDNSRTEDPNGEVLVRPPGCETDDFAEMMSEIIPQIAVPSSFNELSSPSSPRGGGHKRAASKEAESPRPANVPKADDVEELLCEIEKGNKTENRSAVHCLLATFLLKKQQKELPVKGNPPDLQERIDQSKGIEWETLSNKQAVKVWKGADALKFKNKYPDRFIGSRFVVTNKQDEDGERVKSRWCLQGHSDPDFADKIASGLCHSPTLSQLSRALILQILVSKGWTMCLGDIKGAFLEAGPLPEKYRPLFAKQPVGGVPGLEPEDVIEVTGNVYGSNDAPFNWWVTFDSEARAMGWERSQFDSCLYYLRDSNKQLVGVMGAHVDDTITGGDGPRYQEIITNLKARFPYRKWRVGNGEFCGVMYRQDPNTKEISYGQREYAEHLRSITLSKDRLKDKEALATDREIAALRAVNGAANWLSSQSRPDLCVQTSFSQQCFPDPKVKHLVYANQLIHRAKQYSGVEITVKRIDWERLSLCFHSDAGFANAKDNYTQGGYVVAFCSDELENNQASPWTPFTWKSMKLPRVVSSTLGAESQVFSMASAIGEWMSLMVSEARNGSFDLRQSLRTSMTADSDGIEPSQSRVPVFGAIKQSTGVTDCKSLFDHLNSVSSAAKCDDKRVAIDIAIIKQCMARTGLSVRWCPTQLQLADALTKDQQDPADLLRAALQIGEYQLNPEASILEIKKSQRTERLTRRNKHEQKELESRLLKLQREDRQNNIQT